MAASCLHCKEINSITAALWLLSCNLGNADEEFRLLSRECLIYSLCSVCTYRLLCKLVMHLKMLTDSTKRVGTQGPALETLGHLGIPESSWHFTFPLQTILRPDTAAHRPGNSGGFCSRAAGCPALLGLTSHSSISATRSLPESQLFLAQEMTIL